MMKQQYMPKVENPEEAKVVSVKRKNIAMILVRAQYSVSLSFSTHNLNFIFRFLSGNIT
jgi:hypothetical protein